MDQNNQKPAVAVWVVTPKGAGIAQRIAGSLENVTVHAGKSAGGPEDALFFDSMARAVEKHFRSYDAHVFVMATGIAVRMIGPLLDSKHVDPAVVAVDESAAFAVSLVSGHLGGANAWAEKIAAITGACPVITTATDRAGVPAIDLLAKQHGLTPNNPEAVKAVSMALISGKTVLRYDPYQVLGPELGQWTQDISTPDFGSRPGIYVCHHCPDLPENVLVLRPASLAVGVGLNSGTDATQLCEAVYSAFKRHRLSVKSIREFATICEKTHEPGLREMARHFASPLTGYSRAELAEIRDVPTPSETVEKHMGVKSVCEAAAIKAARSGQILVPKQKTKNTTVAVAALDFLL
ncbi:cobalt-precorrin 5A hydrolase [Desulfosalsimonas propionicica]|uniref:Cobalt-precorrin 5A hydrolase n=1 Tax=Desulfosalsimonas propionicica TaxID=332175 RepID=A0A7W0C9D1_9BACT|nr:cobalt-precorrin 5A hydrolase [Desulfosalsimonas propionicica]MBA2881557.1 cobalt-precorrin 5A hydrolase [Desulfosalsimonas propionicica]